MAFFYLKYIFFIQIYFVYLSCSIKKYKNMKKIILTLQSTEQIKKSFCTINTYIDNLNRKIIFRDTNVPFEYLCLKGTDTFYLNKKIFSKVIDAFVNNALDQNEYEGGFNEAIKELKINC